MSTRKRYGSFHTFFFAFMFAVVFMRHLLVLLVFPFGIAVFACVFLYLLVLLRCIQHCCVTCCCVVVLLLCCCCCCYCCFDMQALCSLTIGIDLGPPRLPQVRFNFVAVLVCSCVRLYWLVRFVRCLANRNFHSFAHCCFVFLFVCVQVELSSADRLRMSVALKEIGYFDWV